MEQKHGNPLHNYKFPGGSQWGGGHGFPVGPAADGETAVSGTKVHRSTAGQGPQ